MSDFYFAQIVLINFPFVGSNEIKKRQALVLIDTKDEDLIVSCITSQPSKSNFDVEVINWQKTGLLLPSFVRLHKIATIEKKLIERVLGNLDKNDKLNVQERINALWKIDPLAPPLAGLANG